MNQYNILTEHIKCAIDIYGVHIVVFEKAIGNTKDELLKEIQTPYYTKAYQLEQFRQVPVNLIVRGLPE